MLSEAAGQVDEEGLLFLLRQANTLIHNKNVDDVNRELAELSSKPGRAASRGAGLRTGAAVSIDESDNRSAIFITLGSTRKVLNLQELKQLVRICYAAETKTDALRQLYRVLARERSDILADAGDRKPREPARGRPLPRPASEVPARGPVKQRRGRGRESADVGHVDVVIADEPEILAPVDEVQRHLAALPVLEDAGVSAGLRSSAGTIGPNAVASSSTEAVSGTAATGSGYSPAVIAA